MSWGFLSAPSALGNFPLVGFCQAECRICAPPRPGGGLRGLFCLLSSKRFCSFLNGKSTFRPTTFEKGLKDANTVSGVGAGCGQEGGQAAPASCSPSWLYLHSLGCGVRGGREVSLQRFLENGFPRKVTPVCAPPCRGGQGQRVVHSPKCLLFPVPGTQAS